MSETPKFVNSWDECQVLVQLGIVHMFCMWLIGPDGKKYGRRRDVAGPSGTVSKVCAFDSWDDLTAAAARFGVTSWQRTKRGTWLDGAAQLPAGIKQSGVGRPCGVFIVDRFRSSECDRVATETGLCNVHQSAVNRREANRAQRDAAWAQRKARVDEQIRRRKDSADWAQRIRDEFQIHVDPDTSGYSANVLVNPEGLYALLVAVARDAEWIIGEDLPIELRIRPTTKDTDPA